MVDRERGPQPVRVGHQRPWSWRMAGTGVPAIREGQLAASAGWWVCVPALRFADAARAVPAAPIEPVSKA
ncbi:hypothetical protein GCM10009734_03240 [Nonomuraea bangladeshensis]